MFDHFSTLYMKSLTDIVKANVDRVNSLVYYVANTYSLMSVGSKKSPCNPFLALNYKIPKGFTFWY